MITFMEYSLPKLSQTDLYIRFNETSDLTNLIKQELTSAKSHIVSPDKIPEIISLMRLNGDNIVKKALKLLENGDIILIFNPSTSKIPSSLPYIVNGQKAFIFADKVVNDINSSREYTKLMAVLEAAYLALLVTLKPDKILLNRQLVLTLCNIYTIMVTAPMEQRLYVKGDNLTKIMLYAISFFYRIVDGDAYDPKQINGLYKRMILDKVDAKVVDQIATEVKEMVNPSFMNLIELMKQINPVRYKDIDASYVANFIMVCGSPILFALENLSYLFLLVSSVAYKTSLTGYSVNKALSAPVKKTTSILKTMFA